MEKNVPTIMKSLLQTNMLLGKPYVPKPHTTLNEALFIQTNPILNPDEYPTMKVMVIGNGGLKVLTGTDGLGYFVSYVHKPTDTGLFNQIPFLVRALNDDIGDIERNQYRLRGTVQGYDGNTYIAYYGKVVDLSTVTSVLETRTVDDDGTVNHPEFTPGTGNLHPQATLLDSGTTVTTTGTYVSASTKIDFLLNSDDVIELLNAAQVMYNSHDHSIISEIGFCAGIDRSVTNGTVAYTESLATTIMSFLTTNFPAASWSTGIKYTFDVGNSEPLLAVA